MGRRMKSEFISQTINTIADSIQEMAYLSMLKKSKVESRLSTKGSKSLETICALNGWKCYCGVREQK
jgi:hypothetical protein